MPRLTPRHEELLSTISNDDRDGGRVGGVRVEDHGILTTHHDQSSIPESTQGEQLL